MSHSDEPEQADATGGSPRVIARELAAGFGVVSLVALATCGLLLALINQVSGQVMGMRGEEGAIREGYELTAAVREQHLHLAQYLIDGDARHLARHRTSSERVRAGLRNVAARLSVEDRWRLAALAEKTDELAGYFPSPETAAAERARLLAEGRSQALAALAQDAAAQADLLARAVESRMVHSHVLATESTHLGLLGGAVGAIAIIALSVGFTVRLRRAVLRPLSALAQAARRFGAGQFDTRVGQVGRGELLAVAQAFDRMAEELAARERAVVHHERMAAIGHLAAGVAHELNNPIAIIRGYLKTMGSKDDPETLAEELAILDEEAAQCQRIAEDLLAYARPQELRLERVAMKELLEETVRRAGEGLKEAKARLSVEAEPVELLGDKTRLRQVVLNLLHNAVQVSPDGAPVTVRGRAENDQYVVEVKDRGPGVPPEDQGRIFEPFYSKRKGGSGLGLSVCQGIVRAHGGTVSVESTPGEGALFRVRLPGVTPGAGGKEARP